MWRSSPGLSTPSPDHGLISASSPAKGPLSSPEGVCQGLGPPRMAALLLLWTLSAFLWLVFCCPGEARRLWAKSNSKIPPGSGCSTGSQRRGH